MIWVVSIIIIWLQSFLMTVEPEWALRIALPTFWVFTLAVTDRAPRNGSLILFGLLVDGLYHAPIGLNSAELLFAYLVMRVVSIRVLPVSWYARVGLVSLFCSVHYCLELLSYRILSIGVRGSTAGIDLWSYWLIQASLAAFLTPHLARLINREHTSDNRQLV